MSDLAQLLARAQALAVANGYTRPGGPNRKPPRRGTPVLSKDAAANQPDRPDEQDPGERGEAS